MKACTVEGCPRPHYARGCCNTHYQRLKRNGTTDTAERAPRSCLAAGCSNGQYSLRLCTSHYQRLRQTGRLELPTVLERLVASCTVNPGGCWIWSGTPDAAGYARLSIDGRLEYAHRASYETFVGPIPGGLTIDHVRDRGCTSTACINPTHLEPVTRAENTRREMAARSNPS